MTAATDEMRLQRCEVDLQSHARIISDFTGKLAEISTKEAVRDTDQQNMANALKRIETRLDGIYSFAKWIVIAILTPVIAIIVNFSLHGGFNNIP